MLGANCEAAALAALEAFPGGLHIGGMLSNLSPRLCVI
jgi:hypothetical protein